MLRKTCILAFTTFPVTDSVKCCCISSQFRFPVYFIYVEIYAISVCFREHRRRAPPPGSKSWRRHCEGHHPQPLTGASRLDSTRGLPSPDSILVICISCSPRCITMAHLLFLNCHMNNYVHCVIFLFKIKDCKLIIDTNSD